LWICRKAVDLLWICRKAVDLLWICRKAVDLLWVCCTANPQQIEQVEFELNHLIRQFLSKLNEIVC
jgi:hypothetical protein